ncbi:MAG: resolvase, partial [Sarcina ventriculi]|nr:resolvase [Sarcina ventriculi]
EASDKKSGRKQGKLDKMSDKLRDDIKEFLSDRSIKQIDLMNKHNISRNTLKKYISIVKEQ